MIVSYINKGENVIIIDKNQMKHLQTNFHNTEKILLLENYKEYLNGVKKTFDDKKNKLTKSLIWNAGGTVFIGGIMYATILKDLFPLEFPMDFGNSLIGLSAASISTIGIHNLYMSYDDVKSNNKILKAIQLLDLTVDECLKLEKTKSVKREKYDCDIHYLEEPNLGLLRYYMNNHDALIDEFQENKIICSRLHNDFQNMLLTGMVKNELQDQIGNVVLPKSKKILSKSNAVCLLEDYQQFIKANLKEVKKEKQLLNFNLKSTTYFLTGFTTLTLSFLSFAKNVGDLLDFSKDAAFSYHIKMLLSSIGVGGSAYLLFKSYESNVNYHKEDKQKLKNRIKNLKIFSTVVDNTLKLERKKSKQIEKNRKNDFSSLEEKANADYRLLDYYEKNYQSLKEEFVKYNEIKNDSHDHLHNKLLTKMIRKSLEIENSVKNTK